jgi:hypothetical protein
MKLRELAMATFAMALIAIGAYATLLGVGERARAEVSCGYVPTIIYEGGWARECHLDGNATVCVYRPTRYATTINIHTCVWQTSTLPPLGIGLIYILAGALVAVMGAILLIKLAIQDRQ